MGVGVSVCHEIIIGGWVALLVVEVDSLGSGLGGHVVTRSGSRGSQIRVVFHVKCRGYSLNLFPSIGDFFRSIVCSFILSKFKMCKKMVH